MGTEWTVTRVLNRLSVMESFVKNLNAYFEKPRQPTEADPSSVWTEQSLGDAIGVSRMTINRWRKGKKYFPNVRQLYDLAAAFHVAVLELLGEDAVAVNHEESEVLRLARMHGLDRAAQILYAAIPPPNMDPQAVRVEHRERRGRNAAN